MADLIRTLLNPGTAGGRAVCGFAFLVLTVAAAGALWLVVNQLLEGDIRHVWGRNFSAAVPVAGRQK